MSATSRSRSTTREPKNRDEQILLALRKQGSIVNSSRSRNQTRAQSLTRHPNHGSALKNVECHKSVRAPSPTRMVDVGIVSVDRQSRSSSCIRSNVGNDKQSHAERSKIGKKSGDNIRGFLSRGRMNYGQSVAHMPGSSGKSASRCSKAQKNPSATNGKSVIVKLKSDRDLKFGSFDSDRSSRLSLSNERKSSTNKMRSVVVGRSNEVRLARTNASSRSEVAQKQKRKPMTKFRAAGLGKRRAIIPGEKVERESNAYEPSLSIEESREMPSLIVTDSCTVSMLESIDGATHRGMVDEHNEIHRERAREDESQKMKQLQKDNGIEAERALGRIRAKTGIIKELVVEPLEVENENAENDGVMGSLENEFYTHAIFFGEKADIFLSHAFKKNNTNRSTNGQEVIDRQTLVKI
eukprot:scaffold1338_cov272-Chaetoceros_neogracile.AAC.18